MGLCAQRESYTIHAGQMPKVQDRVRVRPRETSDSVTREAEREQSLGLWQSRWRLSVQRWLSVRGHRVVLSLRRLSS